MDEVMQIVCKRMVGLSEHRKRKSVGEGEVLSLGKWMGIEWE